MSQYGWRGDAAIAQRTRQISKAMACLVIALGLAGFCGWVFHLPALTTIRPAFAAMKFNTAVLFLCLGTALWMTDNGEREYARRILGLLVAVVAGLTLAERAFDIDIGIDQFFFRDTHTAIHPGRMSVPTATCFLLLGLGVLPTGRKKMGRLQRHGMMVCAAISLTALCGYLYGAASFYSMEPFGTMAFHTSIAFSAACLAYFFARRNDGIMFVAMSETDAGWLLRKLIPLVFIVPIVLGWLTLTGEKVGLYKAPFGTSLLVLGCIVCLTALTTMISRSLYHVERERGWVEEALKKSEERFSKAFRESPVVLAITSAKDDRYLDVSESFEQWTGWRRDEVIGRTPFDIGIWVNPAERSEFLRQLQAEGAIRNVEFRYRRKDGAEMVGLGSGELIEIGNEQCVISAVADITERKRAEIVLLRHAAIVDSSEDAIAGMDERGTVTDWNKGAERLLGYAPSEAIGKNISFLRPADRSEEAHANLQKVMKGDVLKPYETVFQKKDGTHVEVSLTVSPIVDAEGRIVGASGIARDITQRKRAERELSQTNERLNLAIEAGRIGGWEWNIKDGRSFWFGEMHTLLGISGDVHSASTTELQDRIHQEDLDWLQDAVQKAMRNHTEFNAEFRVVWLDGSVHWLRSQARFFYGTDGEAERMLGISVDITEPKRAEQALSSMTRKLVEAQEQERSRIGRELHDDVGQRLAMLSIALGQLKNNNNLSPEVRDRIQELKQMASDLATDIHALSHELHSSMLEHLGLVSGMSAWCEEYGKQHKLEIDFKSDDVPPQRQEISLCLFRVLQEALHNAAKYSGVKRITVQLAVKLGDIHLIVSDSGKGFDIEAARQKRGLGLTSMQERVRLIGGTIVIESKPLAGTVVHVCVPFRAERRAQSAAG